MQEWQRIQEQQLKIVELDISRNLLEKWADVVGICAALKSLKSLKVEYVPQSRLSKISLLIEPPKQGQSLPRPLNPGPTPMAPTIPKR